MFLELEDNHHIKVTRVECCHHSNIAFRCSNNEFIPSRWDYLSSKTNMPSNPLTIHHQSNNNNTNHNLVLHRLPTFLSVIYSTSRITYLGAFSLVTSCILCRGCDPCSILYSLFYICFLLLIKNIFFHI